MASFLKLIFIIGLITIVTIALVFFWFYRRIKNIANMFGKAQNKGHQEERRNNRNTYGNRNGVIDARTPEQANRKIFKRDDGEYVEFTEVDEKE